MWSDANSFFIHSFIHSFISLYWQCKAIVYFSAGQNCLLVSTNTNTKKMQAITNYVAKSTHQVIKPADLRIGDGEREVFKMSLGLDA